MRSSSHFRAVMGCVVVTLAAFGGAANAEPGARAELLEIDALPVLRTGDRVAAFSTYDRSGGNDDGFSGASSCLRREGDACIMAEIDGPGAITRIFSPLLNDDPVEFYFDGEGAPRLVVPLREIFSGQHPNFGGDLVSNGVGGHVSYVPISFERSMRILTRSERIRFWMINYIQFGTDGAELHSGFADEQTLPAFLPEGRRITGTHRLRAGDRLVVFETRRPGRIQSIRLSPASAFDGADRDIVLRIYWDGASTPAVEAPIGDLFGYYFGEPAARSHLFGTDEEGWNYIRFPMPFAHSARIELFSERTGGLINVQSEIVISDRGKQPAEGWFHAAWVRENPTTTGHPFTVAELRGRGHLVGVALQAQGMEAGSTVFFEGDDEVAIDGEMRVHGMGSEDAFNGGWYAVPGRWNERRSFPLSGSLGYEKAIGRTGGYRVFLGDRYSFDRSLTYTFEHGPEGNSVPADYAATSYFYLDRPDHAGPALLPLAARQVQAPRALSFDFFPFPPPIASLTNASLSSSSSARTDDGQWSTFATLATQWVTFPTSPTLTVTPEMMYDWFGAPSIGIAIDVPQAGLYDISLDGITRADGGLLQVRLDDRPVGESVDFADASRRLLIHRQLATLQLERGLNTFFLSISPRDGAALPAGAVDLTRFTVALNALAQ